MVYELEAIAEAAYWVMGSGSIIGTILTGYYLCTSKDNLFDSKELGNLFQVYFKQKNKIKELTDKVGGNY